MTVISALAPPAAPPPPMPTTESAEPAQVRLTAADLALLPPELSGGAVRYELHQGRLIIMPPPGDFHSVVTGNLGHALKTQGEMRGHGRARPNEFGLLLGDSVYGPDAGFVTNARLPIRRSTEGYMLTIPDLIAEVRSKNDTLAYMARKAATYLAAGVRLVWVIDPVGRRVFAYRAGQAAVEIAEDGELTCDDIIPGFRLAVREALAE